MGNKSSKLTFGVELELILKPDHAKLGQTLGAAYDPKAMKNKNDWTKCVADLIRVVVKESGALHAYSEEAKEAKKKGEYYTHWTVIDDGAVVPEEGQWAVEVVSRVMRADQDWTTEFGNVWSAITNHFKVVNNDTCSTHIHLKLIPAESEEIYGVKQVAKFVAYWDPCVYHFIPPKRQESVYCRSNVTHSTNGLTKAFQTLSGSNFKSIFNSIDQYKDEKELCLFVCPQRDFAWNFTNIYWRREDKYDPTGTIEFRRPPGSASLPEIFHWVTFGLSFIHGCFYSDPDLYEYMAESKIPDIGILPRLGIGKMSDELIQWADDVERLEVFRKWLTVSANQLKLADHLKLDEYGLDKKVDS